MHAWIPPGVQHAGAMLACGRHAHLGVVRDGVRNCQLPAPLGLPAVPGAQLHHLLRMSICMLP